MTKGATLTRFGAWPALAAIIVLSVVPGTMRPHVLGNDRAEHFIAYLIVASLFAIGYLRPLQLLSSGLLLTLCAGALELAQLSIPGRLASPLDFLASTTGIWTGFLIVFAVRRIRGRVSVEVD